jgi:hypothetical protein
VTLTVHPSSSIKIGRAYQVESREKTDARFSEFGLEMENIKPVLTQAPRKNIMEESFAIKHGFTIHRRPKDLKQFELGNGRYVWSVGRVCVPVELPGSTFGQKKHWFHVLPNCPVPLILGMKFLKEAEIFTKNRHML